MNVEDTNQITCSACGILKPINRIIKNRKVCKDCCNQKKKEAIKNNIANLDKTKDRTCKKCNIVKNITLFSRDNLSYICIVCSNIKRREKYTNNEELRKKAVKQSTEYKKNKKAIRDKAKQKALEKLENEIGKDNTICKYCKAVKAKTHFRHNRLKCKDCERDDPKYILHKQVRSRIHSALIGKKSKHTHEYLGCSREEYIKWLLSNKNGYNLDNYGTTWHIDHVIPLSKFDLTKEENIMIAFNWRNTMPLSAKENLAKNAKILVPQIKEHYQKLQEYHQNNNMPLPQKFVNLYAKHLAAGIPLEP
jgi:hypothetical protein